jgi:small basic protein
MALMQASKNLFRATARPLFGAIAGVGWTLLVPTFRALAGVFLIVAAVALASDLGPITSRTERTFQPTPVLSHWQQTAPNSLSSVKAFFTARLRAWVWDAFSAPLRLPTFVFFTMVAALFGYLGRHRRRVDIFAN